MITPENQADKTERKMYMQLRLLTKPIKVEIAPKGNYFKWDFESNMKKYIKVVALAAKVNIDMGRIPQGRTFKFLSRDWNKAKLKDTICKYYTNPMSIEVTQKPTVQEMTDQEKGIWQKLKGMVAK